MNQAKGEQGDFYGVPKAAQMLGIARSTMHRWILEGRIPNDQFLKMGRNYRIRKIFVWDIRQGKIAISPKKRDVYVRDRDGGTGNLQGSIAGSSG